MLRRNGHEVIVYERDNSEIEGLNSFSLLKKLFWNREAYNDIRKIIGQHHPDIMHCTNTFPLISTSVYDAAAKHNIPVVQSFRNYRLFCANSVCVLNGKSCQKCLKKRFAWPAVWNSCYRDSRFASFAVAALQFYLKFRNPWRHKVTAMYTLSQFARRKLIEHGLPPEKLFVKPNFVSAPPEPGTGRGGYAVFAGRLSHEKGIATLLKAWKFLELPINLIILGDGPLRPMVKEYAAKDKRIIWKGRCAREKVFETIKEASFLIIPSISFETFGRTIIEAYSAGTPVIGSNDGAIAELVEDEVTGLKFEVGNSVDLARKVKLLAENFSLCEEMRTTVRERFMAQYTDHQNYQHMVEIYQQAIDAYDGRIHESKSVRESPEPTKVNEIQVVKPSS